MIFSTILFSIFIVLAHDQPSGCKCGGKYANGRSVTGCVKSQCQSNSTANIRCVVIYKETKPIGYDCVPWPAEIDDCAIFGDGSRVCAKNTFGSKVGGVFKNDDSHALVTAQISHAGLKFVMGAIRHQAEIEVPKFKIPDQKISTFGTSIAMSNITILDFKSPRFEYILMPPSIMKILMTAGDFKACMKMDVKMLFISGVGRLCVWSEEQKGVDIDVKVRMNVEEGHLGLTISQCSVKLPIDLSVTGIVGTFMTPITNFIEDMVQNYIGTHICKAVDKEMNIRWKKILGMPGRVKINDQYGLNYIFQSIHVAENAIKLQLAVNGTFTEKKKAPT